MRNQFDDGCVAPLELTDIPFFNWMNAGAENSASLNAQTQKRMALSWARLLAESHGTKDHPVKIQHGTNRVFLLDEDTGLSSRMHSALVRTFRRVGYRLIPPLQLDDANAWDIMNIAEGESLARLVFFVLYRNPPEQLFNACVSGLASYGQKISGFFNHVRETVSMNEVYQAWISLGGEDVDDPSTLFNLLLNYWMGMPDAQTRNAFMQRMADAVPTPPDEETPWHASFQTVLLLRYEVLLRQRLTEWMTRQCDAHPRLYPQRRDALISALNAGVLDT